MFRDGLLDRILNANKSGNSAENPEFVDKMLGVKTAKEREREEREKYALKYAVIKEYNGYVLHRISEQRMSGQRLLFATRCNTLNSINEMGGEEIFKLEQGRVVGRFSPADYYLSSRGVKVEGETRVCEKCFPNGVDYDYEN